jgi:hypothetical protein
MSKLRNLVARVVAILSGSLMEQLLTGRDFLIIIEGKHSKVNKVRIINGSEPMKIIRMEAKGAGS